MNADKAKAQEWVFANGWYRREPLQVFSAFALSAFIRVNPRLKSFRPEGPDTVFAPGW
jgi:hypothetical protein